MASTRAPAPKVIKATGFAAKVNLRFKTDRQAQATSKVVATPQPENNEVQSRRTVTRKPRRQAFVDDAELPQVHYLSSQLLLDLDVLS